MHNIKEKVSIIIPAYNEEGHIEKNLKEVISAFEDFGCQYEIILFDDGSTDNTYERAREFANKFPQIVVKKNPFNIGKGRALKRALRYCNGEYIVWLDADMDLHPLQIQTLFDIMRLDEADCVVGSKLHPNSIVAYPLERKIMSWVYYFLVRILFDLPCHDTQTGLKLFKANVLKDVFSRLLVKKFAFDLEVLVNISHLGFKIMEAPIILNNQRRFGRIGIRAIFATLWDTLAIFYRMNILKYYDNIDYYRRKNLAKEFRRLRK